MWILALIFIKRSHAQDIHPCWNKLVQRKELTGRDCSNSNIERIPTSQKDNIEFLDFRNCPKLKFHRNDFTSFNGLYVLEVSHIAWDEFHEPYLPQFRWPPLKTFSFTDSQLTDENHMWQLPTGLTKYVVDRNKYKRLDVSDCPKLQSLSADDNLLEGMPKLSEKLPPLSALFMKNNPLSNFSVTDIVKLCNLKELGLQFPPNSYMLSPNASCKCRQIERWIEGFGLKGSSPFDCASLNKEEKCDLAFADLKNDRMSCPDAHLLPLAPISGRFWIYVIIGILVLAGIGMMLAVYMVYRNFASKETPSADAGRPGVATGDQSKPAEQVDQSKPAEEVDYSEPAEDAETELVEEEQEEEEE